MINEIQFNNIVSYKIQESNTLKNFKKFKNNKTLFGSPLKKFLNNIYNKLDIPEESFIISLYYLNKFYFINKNNLTVIDNLFRDIKMYVFTSIIISLKFILDFKINIHQLCTTFDINYDTFIKTELIILTGLNWEVFLNEKDFIEFKIQLEHHKD